MNEQNITPLPLPPQALPRARRAELCALLKDFIRQDAVMVVSSGSLMQRLVARPAPEGEDPSDNKHSPHLGAAYKVRTLLAGCWVLGKGAGWRGLAPAGVHGAACAWLAGMGRRQRGGRQARTARRPHLHSEHAAPDDVEAGGPAGAQLACRRWLEQAGVVPAAGAQGGPACPAGRSPLGESAGCADAEGPPAT